MYILFTIMILAKINGVGKNFIVRYDQNENLKIHIDLPKCYTVPDSKHQKSFDGVTFFDELLKYQ